MNKLLRILYIPYIIFVFFPLLGLSTVFFGSLTVILVHIVGPRLASVAGGTWWARFNSFITPMLVTVTGRENIDKKQSYVVVSNHQSHYDIFVLYGWLGIDFKWVMKKELRKIPFLGYACDKLGHIYIDRSDRRAALASLEEAKTKIKDGTSVIFFPEGTRSQVDEMLPFKKGAFQMAVDLGLPLLPVTIQNTKKILPPKTFRLFPGRAKLIIHPPISVDGFTKENMPELVSKTRQVIQSGLDQA